MTIGSFILKNALRNKRRATLSILSVAVSLFLLVTLLVALRELTLPPEDIGRSIAGGGAQQNFHRQPAPGPPAIHH